MSYKEFREWCNKRAADGCWGSNTAIICLNILKEIEQEKFWRRNKLWKEKFEEEVVRDIVNPINKKIEEVYGACQC